MEQLHIKELFDYVLDNYLDGSTKVSKTNLVHETVQSKLPELIEHSLFGADNRIKVKGSCGAGNKADFPWVCIFNKDITRNATRGIYLGLLFRKDMSGFYLCLNQGITYFENTYKKLKYEKARKVVSYFQEEIQDDYFDRDLIKLDHKKGTLGYGYAQTTVISKFYAKNAYEEDELISDIKRMMKIYNEICDVLKTDNYDYNKAIERILLEDDGPFTPAEQAIEEIRRVVENVTDIAIRRELRQVQPTVKRSKKYSKIRNPGAIKKTDYIEKAKTDAEIGEIGEMLALEHEIDRLNSAGLPDLAEKVRRVSIKSDAFGYDIESFDIFGNKIFIEVKTSINKLDVDFQVSRNEVDTSKEKGDNYYLFRIFNMKDPHPSFYVVQGPIENNFELDPITYMARYVGNKKA